MEELFRKLGMNDNEREVYLAVLKAGKVLPHLVAKQTGINRTTVYSIAKKLAGLGLIDIDLGQKSGYLVAAAPDRLVAAFEKEERTVAEKKRVAIKLAEELSSMASERHYSVPRIRFVEENDLEEFLYVAYPRWEESALRGDRVWRGFQDDSFSSGYEKWIDWTWNRPRDGIVIEFFVNEAGIEKRLVQSHAGRRMKVLPNRLSFDSSLWTTGEYLIMAQTRSRPHYLVEIRDLVLARNQRELFRGLWAMVPDAVS